jgi:hypothetical protein
MAEAILTQLARQRAGEPVPEPDAAFLAQYERRRLTEELAAVFEGVVGSRPHRARRAA